MIDFMQKIIVYLGVPTIVAVLIYIGKKLQILNDLKETMDKVKHNIKVICDTLLQSEIKFDSREIRSFSPFQLTEEGRQKIKSLDFNNIFAENKSDFLAFIDSEQPKTKYDVEIASIKSVITLFEKEYFNAIKSYLYNNPEVDDRALRTTLGVYIRDQYFALHPEIN